MRLAHFCAAAVSALLALACSKRETAKPSAAAPPEEDQDKPTYRPSTPVATHPGFYMPGSQDLDACAVMTPGDLQPVFGKSIAKASSAVGGMSTCTYEREAAPEVSVTILTTAGLRRSAAEHFAQQIKALPKAALTEIPGAGDAAAFVAEASMMWVRKGDVIVQLSTEKPTDGEGFTQASARKLAPIVAGKLAQLPAGAGQERKSVPVTNAAALDTFDVCGLVTDAEASAIFGVGTHGDSVRGHDGTHSTDGCVYENRKAGTQLLTVIAWTPAALKKAGHGTAAKYFTDLAQSPILRAEKVTGMGDEAARAKDMFMVRSKNSVLHMSSREPEEKLKAFAKIAISRL